MKVFAEVKSKVLDGLKNGLKPRELAARYDLKKNTIYRWNYRWRKSGVLEPVKERKKRKLAKILDF